MTTEDFERVHFGSSTEETMLEEEEFSKIPSESLTTGILKLAVIVDQYYTPALCLFGALGNILSVAVFFTKSHKARGSLSSSVYLSALALSDTGFLINLFITWLQNIGIDLLTNVFICPTVMYLGQVTGFLSVWFIVAFTVERFFAVCYPLSRPSRCTVSRARKITLGLTIFAIIAFSYVFFIAQVLPNPYVTNYLNEGENEEFQPENIMENITSFSGLLAIPDGIADEVSTDNLLLNHTTPWEQEKGNEGEFQLNKWSNSNISETKENVQSLPQYFCTVPQEYMTVSRISNYVDSILTFIIPFVIISSLNMKIIFCVKKFKSHRETLIPSMKTSHSNAQNDNSCSSIEKSQLKHYLPSKKNYRKTKTTSKRNLTKALITERRTGRSGQKSIGCYKCKEIENHPLDSSHGYQAGTNDTKKSVDSSIENDIQSAGVGPITPPFKRTLRNPSHTTGTEIRVTKTLLLVSTVFLLLHFPSHSIRLAAFIQFQSVGGSAETQLKLHTAQLWANILFNTNFAINFLLYCFSGKAFRHSVKNLLYIDLMGTPSPARSNNITTTTTQLPWNSPDSLTSTTRIKRDPNSKKLSGNHV